MEDDEPQARIARTVIAEADMVVLPITVLCELVWVLGQAYGVASATIAHAMTELCHAEKMSVDRRLFAAGLAMMKAGGDFADGVIAHEGRMLGAEVFVSFDVSAVKLLAAQGVKARVAAA